MESKYRTIYKYILEDIVAQRYESGTQIPTEHKLMEQYGVSRITVRKALLALAEDGYITRCAGRGTFVNGAEPVEEPAAPVSPEMQYVSFIVSSSVPQVLEILGGVEQALEGTNLQVHLSVSQNDPEMEYRAILNAVNNQSAGIIVYPCTDVPSEKHSQLLESLLLDHVPLVMLDHASLSTPCNCVTTDGFEGGYKATEYLIRMGHKRIGFISIDPPMQMETVEHRFQGFKLALRKHRLPLSPDHVIRCETLDQIEQRLTVMLRSANPATALFAFNDSMAFMVYGIVNRLGLRIPEDLSLVGFDNLYTSAEIVPPLTTVAQPFAEIGRQVGRLLLQHIHDKQEYTRAYLPVELVERDSVKRLDAEEERNPAILEYPGAIIA